MYRQTDRQTEIFLCLFCVVKHTKHEHSSKGENSFFFNHAITILSLFTYSVCDVTVVEQEQTQKEIFQLKQ